jgi:LL-H family phage holin
MNTTNLLKNPVLANLILVLLPFVASFAYYIFKVLEQRLPRRQAEMLDKVVHYAVQTVEQMYTDAGGAAKKKLAETMIVELFKTSGLAVPSMQMIDAAIEATVFQLQQMPTVMSAKAAKRVSVQTGSTDQLSANVTVPLSQPGRIQDSVDGSALQFVPHLAYTPMSSPLTTNVPNSAAEDAGATLQAWSSGQGGGLRSVLPSSNPL